MIIRTKVKWTDVKELSPEEKERIEAMKYVLGDDYEVESDNEEEPYEEYEKDAIIDFVNDKVYVEMEPGRICVSRLLGGEHYYNPDGNLERLEERLFFDYNLDELYKILTSNK